MNRIIDEFSSHLFWDVIRQEIDLEKDKKFMVKRVLEYGLMHDWIKLKHYYGIDKIAEIISSLRSLEPKALNFIAAISNRSLSSFRCYNLKLSMPKHSRFYSD